MAVAIVSYGTKHGGPVLKPEDGAVDLRYYGLPNPWSSTLLRPLSGRDKPVQDDIIRSKAFALVLRDCESAWHKTKGTLYLACYGGRHRSVAIAEILSRHLEDQGYTPVVNHRDIDRDKE